MPDFNQPFYKEQLITYIGNKRSLLPFINQGLEIIKKQICKQKLTILDGFAGSGIVSRFFKSQAFELHTNDLEEYSKIVNQCYLTNKSSINIKYIIDMIDNLNQLDLKPGFITKNYAPENDNDIKENERVFYTNENAKIIDTIKNYIYSNIEEKNRFLFLAPLIVQASIHTNTSGVFKGFHKKDGKGHFGGAGENALSRIKKKIELPIPIFSQEECEVKVFQNDINELLQTQNSFTYDIAYYDPPYNQHPYGSNYFMLNLITSEDENFEIQSGVSGISKNWNRSAYNKKQQAVSAMQSLLENTNAKYIMISYNNEGIIPIKTFEEILKQYGTVTLLEQDYNTYRGSRNLAGRTIKVKELLWIVAKK